MNDQDCKNMFIIMQEEGTNSQAGKFVSEESIFSIGGICMYSFTILASFGSVSGLLTCHFAIASFTDVPPLAC